MIKKLFKNPWFITIGGGIILTIISESVGLTKITGSIWSSIKWVANLIVDFLLIKFQVSLWFLILLPLLVVGLFLLVLWLISRTKEETKEPSFVDYKEEQFGEVLYRWEYVKDFSGKYMVTRLTHFCPNCRCAIVNGSCPVCHLNFYYKLKGHDEVIALIGHQIETKYNSFK